MAGRSPYSKLRVWASLIHNINDDFTSIEEWQCSIIQKFRSKRNSFLACIYMIMELQRERT